MKCTIATTEGQAWETASVFTPTMAKGIMMKMDGDTRKPVYSTLLPAPVSGDWTQNAPTV